jgi:hypothetical protein
MAHHVMAALVREGEALPPDVLEAVDEQQRTVARLEAAARDLARQRGHDDGHARRLDRGERARERLLRAEAERGPRLPRALGSEVAVVARHARER